MSESTRIQPATQAVLGAVMGLVAVLTAQVGLFAIDGPSSSSKSTAAMGSSPGSGSN
jgi:hypothetical protein